MYQTLSQNASDFEKKSVIVRCNFDVPLKDGHVQDDTRIKDALKTIKTLLSRHARITLMAHANRPDGKPDPQKSLKPVAHTLEKLLAVPVSYIEYQETPPSPNPESTLSLLENLRFWPGEEKNNDNFTQKLTQYGTRYINECFATAHREHASIVGLPNKLPAYLGLSFENEIKILNQVLHHPQKPLVVVLGGAKLKTKEPLVKAFAATADHILVGGKIALDFRQKNEPLPKNVTLAQLTNSGKDITKNSAEQFAKLIKNAGTVVWNGTMGVFEEAEHQAGTKWIGEAVNQTDAFTLVGGGDTETALTLFDLEHHIDHISSGGGAMLTYLTKHSLIGLEALRTNQ